jgi:hypothetical protein
MTRFSLTLLACIIATFLYAQDKNEALRQASSNAVNPIAQVIKFQLQPNYYMYYGGGNQLNLTTRIIVPVKGILLPFIKTKNKKLFSLPRLELPLTSQTFGKDSGKNATGLGDILLVDILVKKVPWGKFGVGPCLGFPTATEPILGSGKWSAGIAGVILYNKNPEWMLGAVAQQYFSYAGDASRPPRNYMMFQPIFNLLLNKGWFLMFNPILTLDWHNGDYTVPVPFGFGKALAKNLSFYLMPEYIVSGPTARSFVIQFNMNTMF